MFGAGTRHCPQFSEMGDSELNGFHSWLVRRCLVAEVEVDLLHQSMSKLQSLRAHYKALSLQPFPEAAVRSSGDP